MSTGVRPGAADQTFRERPAGGQSASPRVGAWREGEASPFWASQVRIAVSFASLFRLPFALRLRSDFGSSAPAGVSHSRHEADVGAVCGVAQTCVYRIRTVCSLHGTLVSSLSRLPPSAAQPAPAAPAGRTRARKPAHPPPACWPLRGRGRGVAGSARNLEGGRQLHVRASVGDRVGAERRAALQSCRRGRGARRPEGAARSARDEEAVPAANTRGCAGCWAAGARRGLVCGRVGRRGRVVLTGPRRAP
jgi:hypothetical protein